VDELLPGNPQLATLIGQRLRDVRRARGWSQQALAEGLFSKGYVSSIEHGKIFPSVRALRALAGRLGVDMSEFFDPALLGGMEAVEAAETDEEAQRQRLLLLEVRALAAAERADVALVLIDSSEGVVEGDLGVADEARRAGCATIVVLSKWDIAETTVEDAADRLEGKLRQRPAIVTSSALTGRNVERVLDTVEELFDRYTSRVGTGALNRAMAEIGSLREPPRDGRRRLNMLYATQYRTRPPRFRIVTNDRSLVTRDYGYFVENQLRRRLGLEGCPVVIDFTSRT
jgi:transcriptional regulator with XRE-family HTH domain